MKEPSRKPGAIQLEENRELKVPFLEHSRTTIRKLKRSMGNPNWA
jgi:hypothetical protein